MPRHVASTASLHLRRVTSDSPEARPVPQATHGLLSLLPAGATARPGPSRPGRPDARGRPLFPSEARWSRGSSATRTRDQGSIALVTWRHVRVNPSPPQNAVTAGPAWSHGARRPVPCVHRPGPVLTGPMAPESRPRHAVRQAPLAQRSGSTQGRAASEVLGRVRTGTLRRAPLRCASVGSGPHGAARGRLAMGRRAATRTQSRPGDAASSGRVALGLLPIPN
jgi:hypothetical protein